MTILRPIVRSVVMCDLVYQDPLSRKWSMLGSFNQIYCKKLPTQFGGICVYMSLTDWNAPGDLSIKITRESLEVIAELPPARIEKQDNPTCMVELALQLPPLTLTQEGRYAIEIAANNVWLHEFIFRVEIVKDSAAPGVNK